MVVMSPDLVFVDTEETQVVDVNSGWKELEWEYVVVCLETIDVVKFIVDAFEVIDTLVTVVISEFVDIIGSSISLKLAAGDRPSSELL